jgi:hypothetical protein
VASSPAPSSLDSHAIVRPIRRCTAGYARRIADTPSYHWTTIGFTNANRRSVVAHRPRSDILTPSSVDLSAMRGGECPGLALRLSRLIED